MAFVPRHVYVPPESITRSYFLGHHRAGLSKMTSMLSQIDMVIECRDYRVPLSSTNPLFEQHLKGRERLIVFTKKDLGSSPIASTTERKTRSQLVSHFSPSSVSFISNKPKHISPILSLIKGRASLRPSLTGTRLLIVGMPNVGKSTLLNALRAAGVNGRKAAKTGSEPGITRSIASSVKIIDADPAEGTYAVHVIDTPGVFMPFVPDPETMLKLSLVGCVKDNIVPLETCVDYLLYKMNLKDPRLYQAWCEPTNEVGVLLERVARKSGRLGSGGTLNLESAALWVIQKWRLGHLGKFMLDDITKESLVESSNGSREQVVSMSRVRKMAKALMRQRSRSAIVEE